jgi:hypothetical protein
VACSAIAHAKLTHVTKPCGCPGGGDGIAPVSLKPASADLGPGETTTLKLKYDKKTRKKAGKVLAEGKKVRARVTVRAKDAAGDVAVEKHTIKLVK